MKVNNLKVYENQGCLCHRSDKQIFDVEDFRNKEIMEENNAIIMNLVTKISDLENALKLEALERKIAIDNINSRIL